ncbi:MAG: formylglycine-generating enzyme family protein [Pseudomonadota bacterium]
MDSPLSSSLLAGSLFALAACTGPGDSGHGPHQDPFIPTDCTPPELVEVQAGTFLMGSPDDEIGCISNDEEQHEVTLTHDFAIGKYELTYDQFETCTGYDPAALHGTEVNPPGDHPVTFVSWHEAAAYTVALSNVEGLAPCYECTGHRRDVRCQEIEIYDCEGYRLPTEAEWEYAARAGTTTAFSCGGNLPYEWGDCVPTRLTNGTWLTDYAVYCANVPAGAAAVGTKLPNSWGLFDVHGNVMEWVNDWYLWDITSIEVDPLGAETGDERVAHGGGGTQQDSVLRSAQRLPIPPDFSGYYLGLRLARTLNP